MRTEGKIWPLSARETGGVWRRHVRGPFRGFIPVFIINEDITKKIDGAQACTGLREGFGRRPGTNCPRKHVQELF